MKVSLDAQLSPVLGRWLERTFDVDVLVIQEDPVLIKAKDRDICVRQRGCALRPGAYASDAECLYPGA